MQIALHHRCLFGTIKHAREAKSGDCESLGFSLLLWFVRLLEGNPVCKEVNCTGNVKHIRHRFTAMYRSLTRAIILFVVERGGLLPTRLFGLR